MNDFAPGDMPFRCANPVQLKIFGFSNVDPTHFVCLTLPASSKRSFFSTWAMKNTLITCLGYIVDYTTQLYGDTVIYGDYKIPDPY